MNFNPIKCKHLRITKKRNPVCATYHLGTDVLTLSKKEKDLGIIMSHNLSWRDHIMLKVNIASRMLGIIKRTCGRRPTSDVFLKLYIHLVRPHLKYACEVWSPHQAYLVDILEGVQRRASHYQAQALWGKVERSEAIISCIKEKVLRLNFSF